MHCDVMSCHNTASVLVEPGVYVCDKHNEKKKYICKHCKVEVTSKTDFRPVLGAAHRHRCPRRYLN